MRIDPKQPIHWNPDPSAGGLPFWQADINGWMREDKSRSEPPTKQVGWRTFCLVAIPVVILLLTIGILGALPLLQN